MARISTTPKTTLSISLYVERMQKISIEALQRNKLYGYVFDRPCEQHGSSKRLQDPYICGDDGGRCSDEEVTAWEGISPLEYYVELRSQRTGSSAAATSSATAEFGVHLPLELLARSSLSVVIYDPFTQSPMVCATLGKHDNLLTHKKKSVPSLFSPCTSRSWLSLHAWLLAVFSLTAVIIYDNERKEGKKRRRFNLPLFSSPPPLSCSPSIASRSSR